MRAPAGELVQVPVGRPENGSLETLGLYAAELGPVAYGFHASPIRVMPPPGSPPMSGKDGEVLQHSAAGVRRRRPARCRRSHRPDAPPANGARGRASTE